MFFFFFLKSQGTLKFFNSASKFQIPPHAFKHNKLAGWAWTMTFKNYLYVFFLLFYIQNQLFLSNIAIRSLLIIQHNAKQVESGGFYFIRVKVQSSISLLLTPSSKVHFSSPKSRCLGLTLHWKQVDALVSTGDHFIRPRSLWCYNFPDRWLNPNADHPSVRSVIYTCLPKVCF